jgi:transposase
VALVEACRWPHPPHATVPDREWALLAPRIPAAKPAGRPRRWPRRHLLKAMCSVLRRGLCLAAAPARLRPLVEGVVVLPGLARC